MRIAHMQKSSEQKTVHRPLVQGALVFRMATFLLARTVLRLLDGWTSRTQLEMVAALSRMASVSAVFRIICL